MCDYSLQNVASRPAKVGEHLITKSFGTGTSGFVGLDDKDVAVCVLPGTEIAFDEPVRAGGNNFFGFAVNTKHKVAIFRQINKNEPHRHHDALEFPDGQVMLLTGLSQGQYAMVLQLPALNTAEEIEKAKRLAIAS